MLPMPGPWSLRSRKRIRIASHQCPPSQATRRWFGGQVTPSDPPLAVPAENRAPGCTEAPHLINVKRIVPGREGVEGGGTKMLRWASASFNMLSWFDLQSFMLTRIPEEFLAANAESF